MPHNPNRFSGFPVANETAEAVRKPLLRCITQLKQGVNEIVITAHRRPEHYW